MTVIFSIFTGIVTFAVLIGTLWTIFGVPTGIILLILNHLKKLQWTKKKIFWTCFGGIIVVLGGFILYFIVSVIQGFLGIPSTVSLPTQP